LDNSADLEKIIGGRYKVIKTTGGGMAIVYFCLDLGQNGLPVALKTFRPEYLPDRAKRERFLREAQIWVDLEYHPNIVQAYRTERHDLVNEVFLVLELVPTLADKPDPSLRSWLKTGQPLPLERMFQIAIGITRGMKYAVGKIPGLVHRDLKPENILIAPDGTARVADFGLASVRRSASLDPQDSYFPQRSKLTGGPLGTPLYMSPEQWTGSVVDQRADIYSFGCICYEMLIGQFAVIGSSINEMAKSHISGGALYALKLSALSGPLKTFLVRCLHPQPASRYLDWKQVEDSLIAVIDELCPGFSYPDDSPIDVSRFSRLQKATSYLAIGSAYLDLGKFEIGKGFFNQALSIAKEEVNGPITGVALANLGVTHADEGRFREAVEYYRQAIDLQLGLGDLYLVGINFGNLGNAYFGLHDYHKARQFLEKAHQLSEDTGDLQSQARWKGNLGNVHLASGDFRQALDLFQASINISREIGDRVTECSSIGGAGQAYENLGNQKKALEQYRLVGEIAEQLGDRQIQGLNLLSIGSLLSRTNQLSTAFSYFQQSLGISREIGDRLLEAKSLGNMGMVLVLSGKPDQAVQVLIEAINVAHEICADDIEARANWSLGLIYEMRADFNKAIQHLRTAVISFKRLSMSEYPHASEHLKTLRRKLGLL
jgi:serine/threonine protein kinase